VLAGVLPVQAVEAVVSLAASYLPLERVLGLAHARTTDDLLVAYAERAKYVTAKAGRPDTSRAASEILRALQAGKIRWAFLPEAIEADEAAGKGIWLGEPVVTLEDGDGDASDGEVAPPEVPLSMPPSNNEGFEAETDDNEGENGGVQVANPFDLLSVSE
jgi:hypothetical protein